MKPQGIVGNQSEVTEFIVQCFSNAPELQPLLFVIFFLIYLLIVTGNTTICATVAADPHLQTPMYWLLSNFSFLEMSYSSVILPKLLTMLVTQHKTISTTGCKFQLFFFTVFTCIEFFLLTVMAYDRYVAVCHPLHYHSLMTLRHCAKYIAAVWTFGFLDPIPLNAIIAKFSFCSSNQIDHFYCDVTPVLKLTCSDTFTLLLLVYMNGAFLFLSTITLTCISYILIIRTIQGIKSSEGRKKAFSTCASHLTCVSIFYGTIFCLYMRPRAAYEPEKDKFFSLLNIVLVPSLNPFIYTLKNKEFKIHHRKVGECLALSLDLQIYSRSQHILHITLPNMQPTHPEWISLWSVIAEPPCEHHPPGTLRPVSPGNGWTAWAKVPVKERPQGR
eukprot:XP_004916511.1 PREDICTED: olfactory receptor 6C74-like [Xenopus tropicalis]